MMGGAEAYHDGIKALSETDFTEDLKSIEVPTLVMHGDDDQIVPYNDAALRDGKQRPAAIFAELYPRCDRLIASPNSQPNRQQNLRLAI